MRDRLIELLDEANLKGNIIGTRDTADYLIFNGVDIPICKVGCVVYTVEGCKNHPEKLAVTAVHQYEKHTSITALSKSQKEYFYEDDDFGEVVFFTHEEAEQALKSGVDNGE